MTVRAAANQLVDKFISDKTLTRVSLAVFIIVLTLYSFGQLSYNDFFWHLSLGKWMILQRHFLTHDIFSYAFEGKLWLNNTWIFDGLLYLLYANVGIWGLSALRLIVFSATFFFMYKTIRLSSAAPLPVIIAGLLITIPAIRNFLRPEITSPLFASFFLYALYAYKERGSRLLFALPLVEIVWVNTHGGFTLGLILIGVFFASAVVRAIIQHNRAVQNALRDMRVLTLGTVLAFTAAASIVNPYGFTIYKLLNDILTDRESLLNIAEWQTMPWREFLTISFNSSITLKLAAWAGCFMLILQTLRVLRKNFSLEDKLKLLPLEEAAIFAFLFISMLNYVRGSHIFTVVAVLLILKKSAVLSRLRASRSNLQLSITLLSATAFAWYMQNGTLTLNTGAGLLREKPESIQFLLAHKPEGNIFNEYAQGSELTWLLYPDYQVFIDGRTPNVYDGQFYWYYRAMGNKNIFEKIVRDYGLTIAVAEHAWKPPHIANAEDWHLVFFDNMYSIYLRDTESNKPLIEQYRYELLRPEISDEALRSICENEDNRSTLRRELERNMKEVAQSVPTYSTFSRFAVECGAKQDLVRAEYFMQKVLKKKPRSPVDVYNLGAVQLKLDKDAQALESYKKSAELQRTKQNMTGIAIAYHNLGDYREADKIFKKALYAQGDFPKEYYQIWSRTSYQMDENERAVLLMHRYIDLIGEDKATEQDYLDLSNAYHDAGGFEQYDFYREKARSLTVTSTDAQL